MDVPKIEIVLSDKEYLFLFEVFEETLHSFDTFSPPDESQSLLLPTSPPPSHLTSSKDLPVESSSAPPKNSTITVQVQVHVASAVLQLRQHKKPLAEFSVDSFAVSFEDGGKEGEDELTTRLGVSVQNIQLVDQREGKASPHYPFVVAPKNRDVTMLTFSFCEYL